MDSKLLQFKWTTSRARDSYGYNVCTLVVDGVKVARCNGGGYDMQGTCLGDFVASAYPERLNKLSQEFYGLTFHDPDYRTPKEVVEREKKGESLGLERYQAFYSASSKLPNKKHRIPQIDGACGFRSVEKIINAIGLELSCKDYDKGLYILNSK